MGVVGREYFGFRITISPCDLDFAWLPKSRKKGSCAGGSDVIPSSPFFFFTVFFADNETCLRDGAAARSLPAIPHGKLQLVPRDDVTQLYV